MDELLIAGLCITLFLRGGFEIDGITYDLVQLHVHTPGEKLIHGKSFPLEAHLVHANESGDLAVVAIMFEEGRDNPFIDSLWKQMPRTSGKASIASDTRINVRNLLPEGRDYYRYSGSLTTPPCTDGVKWIVLKEPPEISRAQVEQFYTAIRHHDNRPVQPLNARLVLED